MCRTLCSVSLACNRRQFTAAGKSATTAKISAASDPVDVRRGGTWIQTMHMSAEQEIIQVIAQRIQLLSSLAATTFSNRSSHVHSQAPRDNLHLGSGHLQNDGSDPQDDLNPMS